MQAVILAAGRGLRLRPLTDKLPKSLVEVNGVSFIVNELDALAKHKEVTEVIIVLGYKKELIKTKIGSCYKGLKIVYVDNDDWDKTNNIYSLWMAGQYVNDDFILMEGDLFFEHKLLDALFQNKEKNIILLSKYDSSMSGTVLEINDDSTIKRLHLSSMQDVDFDYSNKFKTINIYSFTYEFFKLYFKPSIDLYVKNCPRDYWELILGVLVYLGAPNINAHVVKNIKWIEVDTNNDLDMANYLFMNLKEKAKFVSGLHGGLWRYGLLDFCYLVNVYFPNENMFAQLSRELPILTRNYPSAQNTLRKLLSRWYLDDKFNEDNLLVGNGASEFIKILNKHFVKKITIPLPTFNEYEDLEEERKNYLYLRENEDFKLDPNEYLHALKNSGSNFGLLINPNNPTGSFNSKDDIVHIIRECQSLDGIIVDESFINFSGRMNVDSIQSLVTEFPNLIVIHSLAKEFGIPGLRLGYFLTSNKKILQKVREYVPIWNINSVAERFLELFPDYKKDFEESIKKSIIDRDDMYKELRHITYLKTFPSYGNFFLCKIINNELTSEKLFSKLLYHNIFIKDCSNKTSLDNRFVRIAVRSAAENKILIDELQKLDKQLLK